MSKNYVARLCFQADSDAEAIGIAHQLAKAAELAVGKAGDQFVEVGPPGQTLFEVSANGSVLAKKRKAPR
jgi:hypothetical protein